MELDLINVLETLILLIDGHSEQIEHPMVNIEVC